MSDGEGTNISGAYVFPGGVASGCSGLIATPSALQHTQVGGTCGHQHGVSGSGLPSAGDGELFARPSHFDGTMHQPLGREKIS